MVKEKATSGVSMYKKHFPFSAMRDKEPAVVSSAQAAHGALVCNVDLAHFPKLEGSTFKTCKVIIMV